MATRITPAAQLEQLHKELAGSRAELKRVSDAAAGLETRLALALTAIADLEVKLGAEQQAARQAQAALEAAKQAPPAVPPAPPPTVASVDEALELRLCTMTGQIDGLLAENRRLAGLLDAGQQDNQALASRIAEGSQREAAAADHARAEVEKQLGGRLQAAEEGLKLSETRVASLTTQLREQGRLEVLPPAQLGQLMSGFLGQLETGMPNLRLSQGELKLKVGMARSGTQDGFVVAPPDASPEMRATLHEVSLRFDRGGASPVVALAPTEVPGKR